MRGGMRHGRQGTACDPTLVPVADLRVCFRSCSQSAPACCGVHDGTSSSPAKATATGPGARRAPGAASSQLHARGTDTVLLHDHHRHDRGLGSGRGDRRCCCRCRILEGGARLQRCLATLSRIEQQPASSSPKPTLRADHPRVRLQQPANRRPSAATTARCPRPRGHRRRLAHGQSRTEPQTPGPPDRAGPQTTGRSVRRW